MEASSSPPVSGIAGFAYVGYGKGKDSKGKGRGRKGDKGKGQPWNGKGEQGKGKCKCWFCGEDHHAAACKKYPDLAKQVEGKGKGKGKGRGTAGHTESVETTQAPQQQTDHF